MTTCRPKSSLRCWRFTPTTESIPMWVLPFVVYHEGQLILRSRTTADEEDLALADAIEPGSWLVEFPSSDQLIVLTESEYRQHYETCPEVRPE